MKLSDCCGSSPRNYNNDCDSSDIGICPDCGDYCEYEDFEEEEVGVSSTVPHYLTVEQHEIIHDN